MSEPTQATSRELLERLEIIERMVADGRRTTWRWGWIFVVWGVGHLTAVAWSTLRPEQGKLVWGLTMTACGLVSAAGGWARSRGEPAPPASLRTLSAIWNAFLVTLAALLALVPSGAVGPSGGLAVILLLLGGANLASGLSLGLRPQVAAGAGWVAAAVAIGYAPPAAGLAILAAAALLCELAFGLWLMAQERRGGALA